ncbi:MAG TPA: MlaD family protein [Usitatibacter sp.]|nr:MlaD family protein [Usitatibacter sp.]
MDDLVRGELPQPEVVVRPRWIPRLIWLVPAIAVLAGLSLFFERIAREGPEVVITFKSAQGLEPGRTPVRYKDVAIGVVTAVDLSPDYRSAQVTVRILRKAAPLITEGASFWVVRPRIGLTEVSGLGALFSGNYIAFERGVPDRPQRQFAGLDNAMVVAADTPGRRFLLHSRDALRIDVGLPVYYLGLQVGQVISCDVAPDGRGVDLQVFVNAPYDRHVKPSTRFWNASGIDVGVRGGEMSLRTESLLALLVGGIAFEDTDEAVQPAADNAATQEFTLFRDRETALASDDSHASRYVLFFDEPVEGVRPGSPVTLLGVPAGRVKDVRLEADRRSGRLRGRIEVTFAPERALGGRSSRGDERAFLDSMVARRGLRAQLRTANMLTGQRYVAFDYFTGAAPARIDRKAGVAVLPSVPSMWPTFEAKLHRLLDKLDSLPLSDALADARGVMQEAKGTLAQVGTLAADVDRDALPEFVSTLQDARRSLAAAERMMDNTSATLVGPDAPGQRDLRAALQEVAHAASALRSLAASIERHPSSLVWGRPGRDEAVESDAPLVSAQQVSPEP